MTQKCKLARRGIAIGLGLALLALATARYPGERLDYSAIRSTRIVDREGRLLHERRGGRGTYQRPVPLEAVSPWVVLATLAGEDAAFRWHPGVDPLAMARALYLDVRARRFAFGGSTITQQLAKNLDPEPRTLGGKIREAWAAWQLERTLTKDQILEQYLNRADYGRAATGIEAAAERYFGKRAAELSLDEGALLAALPRAPSFYDPAAHPDRVLARRAHLLGLMAKRGWITAAAATAAAAAPLHLVAPWRSPRARHVLDQVLARGRVAPGVPELALTIDLELVEALERRVRQHLELLADAGAEQAGVVVIDVGTGEVLAMVGSRRYGEPSVAGSVNATTALRAPGSTLKPFLYALALADGAHPSVPVLDAPAQYRGYQPRALHAHYRGSVALRDALGSSLNAPAVRTADAIGVERFASLLHAAGLEHLDPAAPHGLSLALGATSVPLIELTNAYATLARGGSFVPWQLERGAPAVAPRRVLDEATAFSITDILADPHARELEFGLETPLDLPFPVAAKTGTSQAFTDNVAVAYTPELAVGVWVGNFSGRPLRGLLAMHGAAPLLRAALLLTHRGRAPRAFTAPPGVRAVEICADDGRLADAECVRRRREWVSERDLDAHARAGVAAGGAGPHGGGALGGARIPAAVAITAPAAGARFVIDPVLDPNRQRVALRATVGGRAAGRIRWLIDGVVVGEGPARDATHWTLRPGRHRVRVETAELTAASAELEFEVEG